jgi:hypothetical protein
MDILILQTDVHTEWQLETSTVEYPLSMQYTSGKFLTGLEGMFVALFRDNRNCDSR